MNKSFTLKRVNALIDSIIIKAKARGHMTPIEKVNYNNLCAFHKKHFYRKSFVLSR